MKFPCFILIPLMIILSISDLMPAQPHSSPSVLRFEMRPTSALLHDEQRRRKLDKSQSSNSSSLPKEWFHPYTNAIYATLQTNDKKHNDVFHHPAQADFQRHRHLSRYERHLRQTFDLHHQLDWSATAKHKTRKLQQFNNYQSAPLSQGYGTHYVHLWIGSPVPQRQSVIVDTGSKFTAFPCEGCKKCGQEHHSDPYFKPSLSATFQRLKCPSQCYARAVCDPHDPKAYCLFTQSYTEGSSWQAYQATDLLYCGGADILHAASHVDSNYSVPFMFGCLQEESGLFVKQLADGIMGLLSHDSTLPSQLYNLGKLEYNMFALCFRKELGSSKRGVTAGTMTLGGVSSTLDTSPMVYAKNIRLSGWYTVHVKHIYIAKNGGRSFSFDSPESPGLNDITSIPIDTAAFNSGKGVIVDSGTTDTYLNMDIFPAFGKVWKEVTGMDYKNGHIFLTQNQLQALPSILVQLQSAASSFENYPKPVLGQVGYLDPENPMDVLLAIPSTSYMEYLPTVKMYASRLYFTETLGGVLGANVMAGHNILFDSHHNRIGFSQSSCAYDLIENEEHDKYRNIATEAFGDDCKLGRPILTTPCINSVDVSICKASDNPTNVDVMGVEVWTRLVKSPGKFSTCHARMENWSLRQSIHLEPSQINCTLDGQCQEYRPCKVSCDQAMNQYGSDIAPMEKKRQHQALDAKDSSFLSLDCNDENYWSACDYKCMQTRIVSEKNEHEVCVETSRSSRDCHIDACGRSDACVVPYIVHAILVMEGNVDEWNSDSSELFRQEFTRVAHLPEFYNNGVARGHDVFHEGDVNLLIVRAFNDDNADNVGRGGDQEKREPTGIELILQVSVFNSKAMGGIVLEDLSTESHLSNRYHRTLLQPIEGLWNNLTASTSNVIKKKMPSKKKLSNCEGSDIYPLARDALRLANHVLKHERFGSRLVENLPKCKSARVVSSWIINTQVYEDDVNYYGSFGSHWGPFFYVLLLICNLLYKIALLWLNWNCLLYFKDILFVNFPWIRLHISWQCILVQVCKWWTGQKWPRYRRDGYREDSSSSQRHDQGVELIATGGDYTTVSVPNMSKTSISPTKRRSYV